MQRVMITGPNGFIGRNLVEQLSDRYTVVAPGHFELDLLNTQAVRNFLSQARVDTVLHCATHNATRTSTKDVAYVLSSNLRMFFNLARCDDLFERMFFFGSGAEFDSRHYLPRMAESYFDTHVPVDDYGLSKYLMTKYAECTERIYNLRVFGCFGPYEDWRIRFISNAICKTLFNMDITMFQNVFFDYIYIDDLVRIVHRLLNQSAIQHHTYNICTGTTVDLLSLAELVRQISGTHVGIHAAAPGLKPEYSGDNQRLTAEIGGIQLTPLQRSVSKLYAWYRTRRELIDPSQLI